MNKEIWKDIPGYESRYQVSNLGNVRSVDRVVINNNFRGLGYSKCRNLKGKSVSPFLGRTGYLIVQLHKDGFRKKHCIHQLVAMAFLSHKPKGYEIIVDHIDNIKANNNLSNLQVISQRENVIRSLKESKGYHAIKNRRGEVSGYQSSIWINGKHENIGYYKTEIDANKAYLKKLNELTNG